MSKGVFIVLTHSYSPSKVEIGKWEVAENCEFVSSLKMRHYDRASLILDVKKEQVVKSREPSGNYQQFFKYVCENYPDHIAELEQKYFGNSIAEVTTSSTETTEVTL
jgi:hypothetical protein